MTDTPNLALPYIDGAQAQKHVTHNEALRGLDALVQLAVLDRDLAEPPGEPGDGARYLVAADPAGDWAGHADEVAAWQDGIWCFYAPRIGWIAYVVDEAALIAWDGAAWAPALDMVGAFDELQEVVLLGIGTTADATNPFAAKLNNALWVAKTAAEGGDGDLRYKLSKEGAANTLSLLFQDDFSGRAEIGLTGDDDFHVKVSPDGATWIDALAIDRTSGAARFNAALALTGDITPAQITANQNDYAPAGLAAAGVLRLSTDANGGSGRALTGLAGGADGRLILVLNVGTNPLTLKTEDAGSTAANRFALGRDHRLQGGEAVPLIYDATAARWRLLVRRSQPAGLFSVHRNGTDQTGLAAGAFNKIQFTTEALDAQSWFDNAANYRFTPQEPGYYLFVCNVQTQHDAANTGTVAAIYMNGTSKAEGNNLSVYSTGAVTASSSSVVAVLAMNGSTDYVEFYGYCAGTTGLFTGFARRTYAMGLKIADL